MRRKVHFPIYLTIGWRNKYTVVSNSWFRYFWRVGGVGVVELGGPLLSGGCYYQKFTVVQDKCCNQLILELIGH